MIPEFELHHFDIFGRFLSKNFRFDRKTDDVISLKMIRTNLVNLMSEGSHGMHYTYVILYAYVTNWLTGA